MRASAARPRKRMQRNSVGPVQGRHANSCSVVMFLSLDVFKNKNPPTPMLCGAGCALFLPARHGWLRAALSPFQALQVVFSLRTGLSSTRC